MFSLPGAGNDDDQLLLTILLTLLNFENAVKRWRQYIQSRVIDCNWYFPLVVCFIRNVRSSSNGRSDIWSKHILQLWILNEFLCQNLFSKFPKKKLEQTGLLLTQRKCRHRIHWYPSHTLPSLQQGRHDLRRKSPEFCLKIFTKILLLQHKNPEKFGKLSPHYLLLQPKSVNTPGFDARSSFSAAIVGLCKMSKI